MKVRTLILALSGLMAFASAHAITLRYLLPMTPEQEPHFVDVSSPIGEFNPDGLAFVLYNTDENFLYWEIEWSGLTGPAWGLHFHEAAVPGGNGPIAVSVFNTPPPALPPAFADNPTFGFVYGSASLTDAQEDAFLNGQWYINMHTVRNGPGEIRAQIPAIPEPAALGLLGLGSLALFVILRRRD